VKDDKGHYGFVVSKEWKWESDVPLPDTDLEIFECLLFAFSELYDSKYYRSWNMTPSIINEFYEFLDKMEFNPPHMEEVVDHNVPHKEDYPYNYPKMLPEIPVIIAKASEIYLQKKTGLNPFKIGFGARHGIPNAHVTGLNPNSHVKNVKKMEKNQMDLDGVPQKILYSAILGLMKQHGFEKVAKIQMNLPDYDVLIDLIKTYRTAVGLVPFRGCVTLVKKTDGSIEVMEKHPSKKYALAVPLAQLLVNYIGDVFDLGAAGYVRDRVFPDMSVNYYSSKWEILNYFMDHDKFDELIAALDKTRTFFIQSADRFFLSVYVFGSLQAFLNKGGNELGTKIHVGQMNLLFERLSCGTGGFKPSRRLKRLYKMYPFLLEREYWEGDFKNFDQSLIHVVLMFVGLFYSTWYDYTTENRNATFTLVGDAIFRFVYKFLYIVPKKKLYRVDGMNFSGDKSTSHVNTVYQQIMFLSYFFVKLEQFKDHPDIWLLKLCIDEELIQGLFYGDDNSGGYPKILRLMFGISPEDYRQFTERFGLTYKYIHQVTLIGHHYFYKTEDGLWLEDHSKASVGTMVFLKNEVSQIYESLDNGKNYSLVGVYIYRPSKDLLFRLCNSDTANSKIDAFMAKVLSLMYLAVGNPESYWFIRRVYLIAKVIYKWSGNLEFDRMIDYFRNSYNTRYILGHLKSLYKDSSIITPPSLEEIRGTYNLFEPKGVMPLVDFNMFYKFNVVTHVEDIGE